MEIPADKKVVYEVENLNLAIGEQYKNYPKKLREGVCIGASVVAFSAVKGHAVNIGVQDASGTEILGSSDYRDWSKTGGEFLSSMKPTHFATNGSINIKIASAIVVAGFAFDAQIIFAVLIDK